MAEERITEVEMRRILAKAAHEAAKERLEKRRKLTAEELARSRFN